MRSTTLPNVLIVLLATALTAACPSSEARSDGDGPDRTLEPDAEAVEHDGSEADGADSGAADVGRDEPDVDLVPVPGPLTFVVTEASVSTERVCDHDGDGLEDNALADLGTQNGSLLAAALSNQLQGGIEERIRIMLHFPWLDDTAAPSDPDAVMISFEGMDTDTPDDESDDFSGEEPFWVRYQSLDACGEPRFAVESVRIDGGGLAGEGGTIPVPFQNFLLGEDPHLQGAIAAGGAGLEIQMCTYITIDEAGGDMGDEGPVLHLTQLEEMLGGGMLLGITTLPGVSPDVDLDGDGLERFVTTDTFEIESCIDGDNTVIPGRDCWQDERMADAFAMVARFEATPALFAGRQPRWETFIDDVCEDGPPEESLFDPPADGE